ncbi:Na(+)-translocating NADH-quinone reductase subunit C [Desulfurivibrio alkaliphilus]|uniref:Na(+)-translocating NADH-quinone reductase subunit C n=1 Tax=Desulfurivibrio alkaliphilus (strain DSM 19089 / UNIQEM U267 / AHT2) TaxID=589865 RepID=D6Z5A1_DESAT|nr:Na(+)-translocating NADH-quinone reductase subunit C [Desulfurivibrio alkaliphilus]ADH84758.1 NADH:ubiquinone oxidoreductase, subunit C [Desulfurivibrio alkaliphilus AHT 2]
MAKESTARTVLTVLLLALVCSTLVAGTAVGLRERQEANQRQDEMRNVLIAADLYQPGADVEELFKTVEARIINLEDGALLPPEKMDPAEYNQLKAALDRELGRELPKDADQARLGRREDYSLVYLVRENGELAKVVLPIRGRGMWSMMHGYVALGPDLNTVAGATFYRHGETPGLGSEIENRDWLAGWRGKKVYDADGRPALRVVKGEAPPGEEGRHQIDGISSATGTLRGVSDLLQFWFGDHGFKPFLERYRDGGIHNG